MKIRYQPRRNASEVELRDIKGGSPLSKWSPGQEQEIPAGLTLPFTTGAAPAEQMDAAMAVFRHGPDFVDAATGKNPIYSCVDCGEETLTDHWWNQDDLSTLWFTKDGVEGGPRQCVGCWLADHPARIVEFRGRDRGMLPSIEKAQAIIAKRSAPRAAAASATSTVEDN